MKCFQAIITLSAEHVRYLDDGSEGQAISVAPLMPYKAMTLKPS